MNTLGALVKLLKADGTTIITVLTPTKKTAPS